MSATCQFQLNGACGFRKTIEKIWFSRSAVDSRSDHHADFIDEICREERAVDAPASDDGEPFDIKFFGENFDCLRKVDAFLAADDVGISDAFEVFQVGGRCLFAQKAEPVFR